MMKCRLFFYMWVYTLFMYASPSYALSCMRQSVEKLSQSNPMIIGRVTNIEKVSTNLTSDQQYEVYLNVYQQSKYSKKIEKITAKWYFTDAFPIEVNKTYLIFTEHDITVSNCSYIYELQDFFIKNK